MRIKSTSFSITEFILRALFISVLFFLIFNTFRNSDLQVSMSLFFLCLIFFVTLCSGLDNKNINNNVLKVGLLLICPLVSGVTLQIIPLPSYVGANSIWQTSKQLGVSGVPTISIAPEETIDALQVMLIPFLIFFIGILLFRTDDAVKTIFRFSFYILSAIVIFGLIQYAFFPNDIMFSEKRSYIGSLTGIFVNRNTAGTFLGLTALIFVIWFCEAAKTARLGYNLERFANGLPMKLGRQHVELIASAIMFFLAVISLLLTQSRGAMVSFSAAFLVLIVLTALYPVDLSDGASARRRLPTGVKIIRATIGIGVAIGTLAFLGGRTLLRIQVAGGEDGRFCVLPGIWEMANDRWLTGWGFGTFRTAFPPYRDPLCGINGTWVRAHNAYLEAYAGLGIIFWPILLIGVFTLVASYWRGIRNRRSMRIYAHVGLSGLVLTLAHSAIDFSIQIPGYATFFALFSALTITASSGRTGKRQNTPKV